MEFEIGAICKNCNGVKSCNKMCILHCGKSITDFISRVDTTTTRIGEYDRRTKNGPIDLVVAGHQIYDLESPSWILKDISITLDASDKFKGVYDKNAFQIATLYCKYVGMSAEETQEITDKIKGINRNKLFVLPFKPHTSCNIDFDNNGELEKKQEAQISSIKWFTNSTTHKINCTINFLLQNSFNNIKTVSMDIKDYINKFRLSQMDIQAKSKNHDKDLIKITDYGIFKPIYVTDKTSAVAIDGTYMYYILNGETHIIGYWDNNDKMKVTTNIKTKAFTKIMDNIEYIRNHKKYMAPYLMYEPNIIEV